MVGICCEYSEYESLEEFNNAYSKEWTLEELKDHTEVIEFEGRTTDAFIGNISKPDKSYIIRAF